MKKEICETCKQPAEPEYLTAGWVLKTIGKRLIIVVPIIFCILATMFYWFGDNTVCELETKYINTTIKYNELQYYVPTDYSVFNVQKIYNIPNRTRVECHTEWPKWKGTITAEEKREIEWMKPYQN